MIGQGWLRCERCGREVGAYELACLVNTTGRIVGTGSTDLQSDARGERLEGRLTHHACADDVRRGLQLA